MEGRGGGPQAPAGDGDGEASPGGGQASGGVEGASGGVEEASKAVGEVGLRPGEAARRRQVALYSLGEAARHAGAGAWGRAFPHYLVAAGLHPEAFVRQQEAFLAAAGGLAARLAAAGREAQVEEVYEQAVAVLPHPELLTNFGSFLFIRGETARAEQLYRRALAVEPLFLLARDRLENLASSLLPRCTCTCSCTCTCTLGGISRC